MTEVLAVVLWRGGEGTEGLQPVRSGRKCHALGTVAGGVELAADSPDLGGVLVVWQEVGAEVFTMGPQVVAKPKMKRLAMTIIAVPVDSVR